MITALKRLAVAAVAAAVTATAAHAAPYIVTFTSSVSNVAPALSGIVTTGDTMTIDITVDNGGMTAASQTWSTADTVSAVVRAGTYVGTWTDNFFASAGFTTDATGTLISAAWFGTLDSPSSVDNFGTGARLFSNSVDTSNGAFFEYGPLLTDLSGFSNPQPVAVDAPVPLPASVFMLLAGLAGLGGLSLRRRRA